MKSFTATAVILLLLCLPITTLGQKTKEQQQTAQAQQQATAAAFDQSPCSELLQHGLYDHLRSSTHNTTSSQIQSEMCSAYNRLQQDKQSGSTQASYKLFGGSLSYSREQLDIVGQMMCSSSNKQDYSDDQLTLVSDTISQSAITAYRECLALNSAGLKSSTIFRESDQAQVTLSLHYIAPIGTSAQTTIDRVVISPANSFTCVGTLWDLQGKAGRLGTQEAAISCERTIASPSTPGATLAGAATITVMTPVGTVNRSFASVITTLPVLPPTSSNGPIFTTPDGNVGIGTSSPTNKLHVFGTGPALTVDGNMFPGLRFSVNGNNLGLIQVRTDSGNAIDFGTHGKQFLNFFTNGAYRISISPDGDIYLRGNVYVNGKLIGQ